MALVKTQNYEGGSDARYDVSKMTPEERENFDSEGRPLGASYAPDQWTWTPGVIGARGGTGPSGGAPSGSGGGFDYQSNPFYQQALAAVNAGGAADAANTRAAIQQALIGFGMVPQGFQDKLGALDETTKALIDKNTKTGISGYARLNEGREKGIKRLIANLSARGMRRSGSKAYGLRENQLGYDRSLADSISGLLGGIGDRYSAYAQNEAMRQRQLADAMRDVFSQWYTPPSGGGGGGGGGSGGFFAPINSVGELPDMPNLGRATVTPGNYSNVKTAPANTSQNPYAYRTPRGGGSR